MKRGRSARELRVGESEEWGFTISSAQVEAARRLAGGDLGDGVPVGVLLGVAGAMLRRDLPGPGTRVESLAARLVGRLSAEETVWARATVTAVDVEAGTVTLALAWTNQRGEGVAAGSAVVRPPPPPGLSVRSA